MTVEVRHGSATATMLENESVACVVTSPPYDPIDLAYAAGVIDSDGCISIRKTGTGFSPRLAVGQVKPEAIDLLKSMFGGHVSTSRPPSHANLRQQFKWEVTNRMALQPLEALVPYLRIKPRQAELAIQCARLNLTYDSMRGKKFAAERAERTKQLQRLYTESRALNWQGKGGPGAW